MNNITYINELEELQNIIDDIIPEEEPLFFIDEENTFEFIEAALLVMDTYIEENPTAVSEPDFYDSFVDSVKELFEKPDEEIQELFNDVCTEVIFLEGQKTDYTAYPIYTKS